MERILNKFYTAEDHSTNSWGVFEHVNSPKNKVMGHLTEGEAIDIAEMLNKEYEDANN